MTLPGTVWKPSRRMTVPMLVRTRMHGAAYVEFAVLTLAMVPLMMAIPMLGRLVDLRHNAELASRYTAWETTVHDGAAASASASRAVERFFSASDTPISSTPVETAANRLWGDQDDQQGDTWAGRTRVSIDASASGVASLHHDFRSLPAMSSALAFFDGNSTAVLPSSR